MALMEFTFKVAAEQNFLCRLTTEARGARVVINLLRAGPDSDVSKAIYTFVGCVPNGVVGLGADFAKEYPDARLISENGDTMSYVVSSRLLPAHRGMDPIAAILEAVGPDAFFRPIVVEGGYIHVSVVSPNETARERFIKFSGVMREHLGPDDFKLIHIGPWDPQVTMAAKADGLTPRQDEVVKMALALGYYDDPRGCKLDDLAKAFGVSKAAIHKRMLAAESKIIRKHLGR